MRVLVSILTIATTVVLCSNPATAQAKVGGGVYAVENVSTLGEAAPEEAAQANGWETTPEGQEQEPSAAPADPPPPRVAFSPGAAGQPSPTPPADLERQRRRSKARGMMIGGWTTFGITYAAALTVGVITIDTSDGEDQARLRQWGRRMTIPIGGPIAAAFVSKSATGTLFSVLTGAAQTTGLALGIAGTAMYAKQRREQRLAFSIAPDHTGVSMGATYRF